MRDSVSVPGSVRVVGGSPRQPKDINSPSLKCRQCPRSSLQILIKVARGSQITSCLSPVFKDIRTVPAYSCSVGALGCAFRASIRIRLPVRVCPGSSACCHTITVGGALVLCCLSAAGGVPSSSSRQRIFTSSKYSRCIDI